MSITPRDAAFQEVVDQAIRTLGDGPVLPSEEFPRLVRNILYPHLRRRQENPPTTLMNKLQTSIDKPLRRLNLDLPSAIDEEQRAEDLGAFVFGRVSAHFARKRLVGEWRSDRPQPAAGVF